MERHTVASAHDLRYSYGRGPVLSGATLQVLSGQVHCLMGANGCGKSTLLDCLLGLKRIEGGSVELFGRDVYALKVVERARLVSYVPQSHARSFPHSVEQVVQMGRAPYRGLTERPTAEDVAHAQAAISAVGIERLAGRPYTELSGGEMQMVLLARALAQNAQLIVMDEPTAHLDIYNSTRFLETVASLVLDRGIAALIATHEPNHALALEHMGCDVRVSLMRGGVIERSGSPDEVLTVERVNDLFGVETALLVGQGDQGDAVRSVAPIRTAAQETASKSETER